MSILKLSRKFSASRDENQLQVSLIVNGVVQNQAIAETNKTAQDVQGGMQLYVHVMAILTVRTRPGLKLRIEMNIV